MISVKNLTKYYDDFQALKGISFEIKSGEIVGILGPNGAGKSTTLRILTSYLSPTSGDAIIDGKSILDKDIEIKKIIGYLPESAPLYNDMCVFDYLVYMADIQELDRNKLSERLNYVLILDEPTNGLDPNQIVEIRELIKELGKEKTVLISTHILSEVEATCSRAIIINKGTIIADNDPKHLSVDNKISSIKLSLKTNDSFETIKTKLNSLDNIQDITLVEEDNNIKTIIVKTTDKEPIEKVYKFIKNTDWIIYEFVKEKENLETVFHTLTKGEN